MKTFIVKYSGSVTVEADTAEQARTQVEYEKVLDHLIVIDGVEETE